jgi:hypothetical protein
MNKSEELVFRLCSKSFLSLWSYPNPKGKKGKELCDILIVCDPDVVIFSVKEANITDSGDANVDWARWDKRAIDEAFKQIYGAERWINTATHVITKEGKDGLPFPDSTVRRIHRVAVALGGQGKTYLRYGDFGKGFVHVFDEISLDIILKELDTITDFVQYLNEKESLLRSGVKVKFMTGEEDMLTWYLCKDHHLSMENTDVVCLDSTLWKEFRETGKYRIKREADKPSYTWDNLIEILCKDFNNNRLLFHNKLTDIEIILRAMARETRLNRRALSKSFLDFKEVATKQNISSRIVSSSSGILYVFLASPFEEDRKFRLSELGLRCFVARGLYPNHSTVIGIATEASDMKEGFSLDAVYLSKETWTPEDQDELKRIQQQFGYFVKLRQSHAYEDEYPVGQPNLKC